ncbi:hypothetical protein GOP47_0012656 [Adiantum capillus-veneris]|uniref:Uncharacterized protein n=1 Tax=Adiantum capillus-veneris TaxID=13818 RepID=A0A9D4ZGP0_ADICA|nr:hypothetical protein GOP47_0012656 [Adiantum capillus-veneris]
MAMLGQGYDKVLKAERRSAMGSPIHYTTETGGGVVELDCRVCESVDQVKSLLQLADDNQLTVVDFLGVADISSDKAKLLVASMHLTTYSVSLVVYVSRISTIKTLTDDPSFRTDVQFPMPMEDFVKAHGDSFVNALVTTHRQPGRREA